VHGLDVSIFHWINGWSDAYTSFYVFLSEATKMGGVRLCLALIALTLIAFPRTRVPTLLALIAFPLANGVTDLLKNGFQALRPCVELADVHLRVGRLDSFGTASAHSANMAAIAYVFTRWLGWWGLIPIALALFTGLARIYVGVHYPSQVSIGWLIGIAMGALISALYAMFQTRSRKEVEKPTEQP
jgi:undecaprenyl-diphosphatase